MPPHSHFAIAIVFVSHSDEEDVYVHTLPLDVISVFVNFVGEVGINDGMLI